MLAHLLEQNPLRILEKEDIDTCEEALSFGCGEAALGGFEGCKIEASGEGGCELL